MNNKNKMSKYNHKAQMSNDNTATRKIIKLFIIDFIFVLTIQLKIKYRVVRDTRLSHTYTQSKNCKSGRAVEPDTMPEYSKLLKTIQLKLFATNAFECTHTNSVHSRHQCTYNACNICDG